MRLLLLLVLLSGTCSAATVNPYDFPWPADARVSDVKRDFGAKGDGVTDDTEAIRKAITASIDVSRYGGMLVVYLPKGTYLVSGPIEGRNLDKTGWSNGWRSGMALWGESRTGSVIRLKDACEGYGDAKKPQWVIATGSEFDERNAPGKSGGNRAFRHNLVNFTLDVGAGNPGAIAIDYVCNNRGTIEQVTLKAGKDSGYCGIGMTRNWPGPALVQDVRIEGFALGMKLEHYQYGMTFVDLELIGQREAGIVNNQNTLFIEGLRHEGSAPLLRGHNDQGTVTLIDGVLQGKEPKGAAIESKGILDLRNLTSTGWPIIVTPARGAPGLTAEDPTKPFRKDFYWQGQVVAADGGSTKPLALPIERPPSDQIRSAAEMVNGGKDAGGLQAALDSGKPVIYLPQGGQSSTATLVIRKGTRRIIGLCASIGKPKDAKVDPLIRFEGGAGESVSIEHVRIEGAVEHAGAGSLALRHCDHGGYRATGPGKSFIDDVIGNGYRIGKGHRLWARQMNAEFGDSPLIINQGTCWILGFKVEKGSADWRCVINEGGLFEMLGSNIYALGKKPPPGDSPCFTHDGGRMSLGISPNGQRWPIWVRHRPVTGEGDWKDFTQKQFQGRGPALLTVGEQKP